ncbi:MAG: glycosyltransferase family 4 protein [Vicingus serpentipes]|nr:glycosyltransferase family 4 protein [Vicingus serpentipes]
MPNKKIHICHLTSVHQTTDVRIFHKECSSLAKKYDVTLLVINGNNDFINDVKIIGVPVTYKNRRQRFTKAVNQLYKKAMEVDADIYHFHDPEILRIAKKLKRKGKKVIYDVHEDLPRQILSKPYINPIIKYPLSIFVEYFENKIASKLDGIITATPHIKERFLRVNKNTISINNFPILNELLLNIDYNTKKENIICYVGGITKIRGIKEIVNSIESLDLKLLIAGDFLENGLREEVCQLKGWRKVEELGFINRKEVKEVYAKSKLGLVTLHPVINYIEALPVKMFEYMAAGLPIIASNFPLWKSIIENNECGICVNPLNPKEIKEAIEYILNNPELASIMGRNGKKLVKEKYNWSIEENKLLNFYSSLIE